MADAQIKAFLAKAKTDDELKQQLRDSDSDPVAIAQAAGFSFTAAELARYQARRVLELSDEELTCVSGGGVLVKRFGWDLLLEQLED